MFEKFQPAPVKVAWVVSSLFEIVVTPMRLGLLPAASIPALLSLVTKQPVKAFPLAEVPMKDPEADVGATLPLA